MQMSCDRAMQDIDVMGAIALAPFQAKNIYMCRCHFMYVNAGRLVREETQVSARNGW